MMKKKKKKKKNNKQEIIKELQSGICELTYMDSHSVEHILSVTLSPNHLNNNNNKEFENPFIDDDRHVIALWNMVAEDWIEIPVIKIIDVERLTGLGGVINKDKERVAVVNLPSIFLDDDDDDDDVMENHPEEEEEE